MIPRTSLYLYITRFDKSQKMRLFLLCYGFFLHFSVSGILPNWGYFICDTLYLLLYFFLFRLNAFKYQKLLMGADYLYALMICWGKPLNSLGVFFMMLGVLLIPLNKKYFKNNIKPSLTCYILTCILLIWGSYKTCVFSYIDIVVYVLICPLCYGIYEIDWNRNERTAFFSDIIDAYYRKQIKPHEIYKNIISAFNQYFGDNLIKDIVCLISFDEFKTFYLVNSSRFIYDFKINISDNAQKIGNIEFYINVDFFHDDELEKNNLLFPIKIETKNPCEEGCYAFLVVLSNGASHGKIFRYVGDMQNVFYKLSRVLSNERSIQKHKIMSSELLNEKIKFVENAQETMHFIRNRLTPIQNLIGLIKKKSKYSSVPEKSYDQLINNSCESSDREIQELIKKAKYFLDDNNNPFKFKVDEQYNIQAIISIVRGHWNAIMQETPLEIDSSSIKNVAECNILLNRDAFDILLSDIVGNIKKYNNGYAKCIISSEKSYLLVTFLNSFSDKTKMMSVVNDINSSDRDEIMKRRTFGLNSIKRVSENLNIHLEASLISKENNKTDSVLELYMLNVKMNIGNE